MNPSLDADVLTAGGGDRDAFARLVTRYRGLVSSLALATLRDVAMSEDVAQEVFCCVWRDLHTLRHPSRFVPWLRQLTRHRALDAARARRRRDRRGASDDTALELAIDPRPNAQEALLDGENARALEFGLESLPIDAREVVTLYYREGQSIEQVAQLLGLREAAAKKRLSRARAALREVLAPFADSVEGTAPGVGFTNKVMLGLGPMTPVGGAALGKGIVAVLTQSAALTLAWAWLAGILGGVGSLIYGLRRELRVAIDHRERKQLFLATAISSVGVVLFEVSMYMLPPRGATGSLRLLLGTAYSLAYTALVLVVSLVWLRRIRARRRAAEVAINPRSATRHARDDQRARLGAILASVVIAAVLAAAWFRG